MATGTRGLSPSPASLHHHLEGMREQRLIGACPRGDPGGNTGDTDSRRRLQTHKQFKKVNGGQTLSGEASDRNSVTQDVNCAQTLASKNAFSPLVLSCRISNFSPIQTPVPRRGPQTISPVAFILQVAWFQGGTNFPMQSGDLSKVQKPR